MDYHRFLLPVFRFLLILLWLIALSLFYALHLKIRLDITTDKRISPSDADLAIVSDIPPEIKGKILFKLESKMHLYTSTSYLERKGAPRDMEDLLENYDLCVQQKHLDDDGSRLLLKRAKHLNTTSDSEAVIFKLVQSGDGVGLLHDWLAREVSNLVRLDSPDYEACKTFFGICTSKAEKTPKIKTLMSHLKTLKSSGFVDDLEFF